MEIRRFSRASLLLIAVAVVVLLFVLNHANSASSYQRVDRSEIASLIKQGAVKSALITGKYQTIQITTKSGKQLEAPWNAGQESQVRNSLQSQLQRGNLPGGYNVTAPQSRALIDGLTVAFLAVVLLSFWGLGYPAEFKRLRAFAGQAG